MNRLIQATAGTLLSVALLTSCGSSGSSSENKEETQEQAVSPSEPKKETRSVPDVVGQDLGKAEADLWAADLEFEVMSDSGKAVTGTTGWKVSQQVPEAGKEVEKGSAVKLVVQGESVVVPDVVGVRYDRAKEQLEGVGLEASASSDSGKMVISSKNWTVISQSPSAGSESTTGETVSVVVSKDSGASEQSSGGSSGAAASQPAKLGSTKAVRAMEKYGKSAYPYGFKMHKFLGEIAREPKDEDTWFLKYEVTVTNEYGAKRDTVAEAYVTGTDDNPQVTYFLVY